MNVIQAVILGLIQGLGEFLPISSSGHLLVARSLMGISDATGSYIMLDILLHAGTLVAVAVAFWKDWVAMLLHPIRNRTLLYLFIASLPALFAVLLNKLLSGDVLGWLETGVLLGVSFLFTGLLLMLTEAVSRRARDASDTVRPKNVIAMGLMQVIGLLPGVSRSGSTISGGVFSGLSRKTAAKFSFMMSAPAVVGSLLYEGKDALEAGFFQQMELLPTVVGVVVAAVSGFLAIRFMLDRIQRFSLYWFALYVILLGVAVIVLQIMGVGGLPAMPMLG